MSNYVYIFSMAATTFLIRVLPLTLIRREITNKTIRSFLYYVPATNSVYSAAAALVIAIILAWRGKSLFVVSVISCITVFILELFI